MTGLRPRTRGRARADSPAAPRGGPGRPPRTRGRAREPPPAARGGRTGPAARLVGVPMTHPRRSAVSVPVMTVPGEPPAPVSSAAVRATGLTKVYGSGEARVVALAGADVTFDRGGFTAIMGPSGSGKSTLMHCLAGLDSATAGQVFLGDTELTGLRDDELTRLRRARLGLLLPRSHP